jgi:hypothetical protein
MFQRRIPHARLAARGVTVAAGLVLVVSLSATWTRLTLHQLALLAVTANGSLGHLSLSHSAWSADAGVAAALAAVAVLVIATGVLNRLALVLPTGLACLAALVFVIVTLGNPPSALPANVPTSSSGVAAHSTAGAGEMLAIIALVLAGIGMWAMLAAAHAERRRRRPASGGQRRPGQRPAAGGRRRRQRATGAAARSSRTGVSAGGPADGSA